MHHELKTDPQVFNAAWKGLKSFEIRKNDRNYQSGDTLVLKETKHTGEEMKKGAPLIYTGRELVVNVSYILHGPIYGLVGDWVIMSIEIVQYFTLKGDE